MAAKRPPKLKADPLDKVRDARKAAEAHSRSVGAKPKGTFGRGTSSASSSNAERKRPLLGKANSKIKPLAKRASSKGGKKGGGGQRRDRKGRFA